MNDFKIALRRISYAFFGKRCEICGKLVELDDELCDMCRQAPVISSPRCISCGYSKEDCICRKSKNEYKQIVAPYYYEDSIVSAIHNFKELDMPFLSERLSADVIRVIDECYADIKFDFVTYVPLRTVKKIKRGYNQSELIAKRIADTMSLPCVPVLRKVRYTGVQHHKTAKERKADIFGAYDVLDKYKNELNGKTILLIDDVKTTGSTLNECAKMLNIYGASAVYAATVALTKRKKEPTDYN